MSKQLIVIGGGAAGFFCAVNAARLNRHLQVTILEKSNKLLSKVKISGGGRCNVTHACFDIAEMSQKYPRGSHFVRKAFHHFFTRDTINWFGERGVKLKTEPDGRMFPITDSSQTIIDCLLREANYYDVEIVRNAEVKNIVPHNQKFQLQLSNAQGHVQHSRVLAADYLCIACGGYPKSSMFDWLLATGHTIEEPVPSLFTFNIPGNDITRLMGISVEKVKIKIRDSRLEEEGPLLITHWGFSGPAILRLSAWGARELKQRNWEFGIRINWLPGFNDRLLKERFNQVRMTHASQKINQKNHFGLPQRLWEFIVEQSCSRPDARWADLLSKDENKLIRNLCNGEFDVKGKTTFKEEFVTAGGIHLNEIDPNTMESRRVPHLYFAGEVMDVDGITGGFNFQHAWTSGFIAARSIAELA